jgi:hypothetical protein
MTTAPLQISHAHAKPEAAVAQWVDDRGYLASASGRIACATLAFALVAAGGIALFGNAANLPYAIPLITLVCIMGGFLATGLAIDRHGTLALAFVLSLPPVAGAYFASLYVLPGAGIAAALPLIALAAIPVVLMVRAKAAG